MEEVMKTSLIALAVFMGLAHSAQATEIQTPSHIDAVTVYPEGADVTRLVEAKLQGDDTTLLIDDVPSSADPQSIRVEGTANGDVAVTSVDSKMVRENADELNAERKKINEQFEGLQDERAALDQLLSDKEAERKLLLALAQHPIDAKGESATPLDAAALDTLVGTVATRLAATSKTIQESRTRQRAIDRQMAELQAQLNDQSPESRAHLLVKVHVHADKEAQASFRLTYRVPDAGWHAFYDAKLSLPGAGHEVKFNLVRQASVEQHTAESWNNVHLTLSTAAPSAAAGAPTLYESEVAILVPQPMVSRKTDRGDLGGLDKLKGAVAPAMDANELQGKDQKQEADLPASAPVSTQEAEVQQAGFTAQYVIAERSDVDNLGTAKNVRISEDELAAKLSVEAVPRLDGNAYLTAAFTAKADAPLLAGPVHLFRDLAYVGQVDMPELAAGEDAKLGFGVDDLVKVKRTEVKRLAAEEGLLTTSNTQEMGWIISVSNLHDFKMPIRILDRKPFSTNAQITVTDKSDSTPASVVDVEHKRGVLAWDLDLAPKGKAEIKTGFKISAPKDMRLSLVD
jgi:uncharacterized protein (TIGR02231 family)